MVGVVNNEPSKASRTKDDFFAERADVEEADKGFQKHFEEFLNSTAKWKKDQKGQQSVPVAEPSRSSSNVGASFAATIQSLFKETTIKTCILGPRGIGKSYLLNTLFEATAPTEKEYADLNSVSPKVKDVILSTTYSFGMQDASQTPYVPQSVPKSTSYSFDSGTVTTIEYKRNAPKTAAPAPYTPSGYQPDSSLKATSYKFVQDKAYSGATSYNFKEDVPLISKEESVPLYTETTGYNFNHISSSAPVTEEEFQWDIGKIENPFVPDGNYASTIKWDLEKVKLNFTPDDDHSFILPQGMAAVLNSLHHFEFRYGKIPELIVALVDEAKLRQDLWEVHEIEMGHKRVQNKAHRDFLEARYRAVLGIAKGVKIPLSTVKSAKDFQIPESTRQLLGKTYKFKGLGKNFNVDRIYVREKLKEVLNGYAYCCSSFFLKLPCRILEGQEITEIPSIDIPRSKMIETVGGSNLLLLLLNKNGITSDLIEVLSYTKYLEKALQYPDEHKVVLINLIEPSDPRLPAQLFDNTVKENFDSFKESLLLQFKLLLHQQSNYSWDTVERVAANTTVFSARPRIFSILQAYKDQSTEYLGNHTFDEALAATFLPSISASLKNLTIHKCAKAFKQMHDKWMQKLPVNSNGAILMEEPEEKVDELVNVLGQFSLSFQDKFGRLKGDIEDKVRLMDKILLPKAREGVERTKGDLSFLKSGRTTLQEMTCGPLIQVAPGIWKDTFEPFPQKMQELLNYSSQVMNECIHLAEKSEDPSETSNLKRLIQFCQMTHGEAALQVEQLKKQVQSDVTGLVNEACLDAISKVAKKYPATPEAMQSILPEIPLEAAKSIKQKFADKLEADFRQLETMEKKLQRALTSILVALKQKTHNSARVNELAKESLSWSSSKKEASMDIEDSWNVEDILGKKSRKVVPNRQEPVVANVCYIQNESDSSRWFSQDAWNNVDPKDNERHAELQDQLKKASLVAVDVQPDSCSQFRALAHQVYGTEDAHGLVRLLVMSELLSNPSWYERFIATKGMEIQAYVARMSKETEQGDHITLVAFANFYGADLYIYSPIFPHPLLIQSRDPHFKPFSIAYLHSNVFKSLAHQPRNTEKPMIFSPKMNQSMQLETSVPCYELVGISTESEDTMMTDEEGAQKMVKASSKSTKVFSPRSLTDICIMKIVQYVDMLPSLNGLLPEELVQKLLTSLIKYRKVDDSVLERVLDSSVRSLELDQCVQITDLSCKHIARTCQNLRKLSFNGCLNLRNDGVIEIAQQCKNLEVLSLAGCFNLSNASIQQVARRCKNLVSLDITGVSKVTDPAIYELCLACPDLRTLVLRGCTQITDEAFKRLGKKIVYLDIVDLDMVTESCLVAIAQSCKELAVLKASHKSITDEGLIALAQNCPSLTKLEINGDQLTDAALHALAQNCPLLDHLSIAPITLCRGITNESFTKSMSFPNLCSLDLSRCVNLTDEAVKAIAANCLRLETLNLSGCEDITDDAIKALASKCQNLKDINLSKVVNVTDASIIELVTRCPLERLVLYNCHNLTNASVSQISLSCPQLKELDLSSCGSIDDTTIPLLMTGCPFLEVLCLESCGLGEEAVKAIGSNGYSLRTLNLAYCKGVTNDSLNQLANCPHLVNVNLAYCTGISVATLQKVIGKWTHLNQLCLRGCTQFTNVTIEHPSVQTLIVSWCGGVMQDVTLDMIASGCPSLVDLDIAYSAKISANAVQRLANKSASLRRINLRGCYQVLNSALTLKYLTDRGIKVENKV